MLLGIKENSEFDGLYNFKSEKLRDEVAKHFEKPILYYNEFKEKALSDFGITKDEIKNGAILIKHFGCMGDITYYLALKGTNYDGVYAFKNAFIRDEFAKDVGQLGEISNNKEAICKKHGISVEEVQDAKVILYKTIRDSLKELAGTSNTTTSKEKKEKKETVKKKEVMDTLKQESKSDNLLKGMLSTLFKNCTVAEVKLVTGEVLYLTLRDLFYVQDASVFQNAAYMDVEDKPCLKSDIIDKLIEDKKIGKLSKSQIDYRDGFVSIVNCDDAYSPNLNMDNGIKLTHQYSHIVINVNQIVSVVGKVGYEELNLTEITPANYKLVYEYLNKKK